MNKKLFLGVVATTGLLCATSCSNDELIEQSTGDTATVSFTVNTDGAVASRAVADGLTATKLYYAAYDQTESVAPKTGELTLDNKQSVVNMVLLKGHTYKLAFWAQAENAPYGVNVADGMKVTMNYGNAANNDEARDAFFANREYTVTGNVAETVTLKRPFAQVNVGTTEADYQSAVKGGYTPVKSTVTFQGTFGTEFDVLNGTVTKTAESVTYASAEIPSVEAETLTVAGNNYEYISTCYVLPASLTESQTVDAEFTFAFESGDTKKLEQGLDLLPIQSNYRTNIVGDLLTGDFKFNVNVDQEFEGEYNTSVWDGTSVEEPALVDGTYQVANAAQWAWLAGKEVNNSIKLTANIDFDGKEIAAIYPKYAQFELDGNGYTLRNAVYSNASTRSPYHTSLISFESVDANANVTIKNLTVSNVSATNNYVAPDNVYGYASAIVGDVQNGATVNFENVTVTDCHLKGIQSVGTLVAIIGSGTVNVKSTTVKNNTLENIEYVDESGYVCGLVGKVVGTLNVASDVVVEKNTIDAFFTLNRGIQSIDAVAAVRGAGVINSEATVGENNITKKVYGVEADLKISNKEELLDFAANYVDYNGKVVALTSDIDLAGVNWQPVGRPEGVSPAPFMGTFDGCGYTISNLSINEDELTVDKSEGIAFFGWLDGTVKNLNFKNATVKGHHDAAVIVGYLKGGAIENCHVGGTTTVESSYKDGNRDGDKAGVLAAYVHSGSIKNCSAKNATVKAVRDAGQAVGCCTNAAVRDAFEIVVENVNVSYIGEGAGNDKDGANIFNEVVGRK